MGCCGLGRRRKTGKLLNHQSRRQQSPGAEDSQTSPAEAADQKQPAGPPAAHHRASLSSVRSSGSIYYDCEEAGEPAGSLLQSLSEDGSGSPANGEDWQDAKAGPLTALKDIFSLRGSIKSRGSSPTRQRDKNGAIEEEGGRAGAGCLPSMNGTKDRLPATPIGAEGSLASTHRPCAGASFHKAAEQVGSTAGVECWQVADASQFMVRGKDYMQTRKKLASKGAIYRLVGVDAYQFEKKLYHIAQHVDLPPAPKVGPGHSALPQDQQLPPHLIINIQLPLYPASLLGGASDGRSVSLVYYFALPEGFEASHMENDAAMDLARRFIHDGREADKSASRDRLKLIARVVNVEQWAKEGPLGSAEHSLLLKYNDKPLLTRPQQKFFTGPNYLEVDLDIHSYAWLARKAFSSFIPRLGPVVFENAFVIQGNQAEELPEMVLACARVSRLDLEKCQPFPASLHKTKSHRIALEMDPSASPLAAHTFPDDKIPEEPEVEEKMLSEEPRVNEQT